MNARTGATRPTRRTTLLALFVSAFLASGCGSGDAPLATVDPEAAPLQSTWDDVAPILDRHCAPCHGDDAAAPGGPAARVAPDYSTCRGTQSALVGLRGTVLDSGSMPPGAWPRLSERDKLVVQRWLDRGACAPCAVPCP